MSVLGGSHNYSARTLLPILVLKPVWRGFVSSGRAWWVFLVAFVRLASQVLVSILFVLAVVAVSSNSSGGFGEPEIVFLWVKRILLRLFLRFSSPGYPALPVERLTTLPLRISSTIFGVFGLPVRCRAFELDRFSFGCGKHAAPAFARVACS